MTEDVKMTDTVTFTDEKDDEDEGKEDINIEICKDNEDQ